MQGTAWHELDSPLFPASMPQQDLRKCTVPVPEWNAAKAATFLEVVDCRALLAVSRELHLRVARDDDLWIRAFEMPGCRFYSSVSVDEKGQPRSS